MRHGSLPSPEQNGSDIGVTVTASSTKAPPFRLRHGQPATQMQFEVESPAGDKAGWLKPC